MGEKVTQESPFSCLDTLQSIAPNTFSAFLALIRAGNNAQRLSARFSPPCVFLTFLPGHRLALNKKVALLELFSLWVCTVGD